MTIIARRARKEMGSVDALALNLCGVQMISNKGLTIGLTPYSFCVEENSIKFIRPLVFQKILRYTCLHEQPNEQNRHHRHSRHRSTRSGSS